MPPTAQPLMDDLGKVDINYIVALLAIFALLSASAFYELKENRIPNAITLPAVGLGFLLGYAPGGITLGASVGGFLIGFFFLFVFYMFGGMGGGDVKLMGAIGALLGHPGIYVTIVYTAVIGGFMAIAVLIWNKNFWHGLMQSFAMLIRRKKPEKESTEEAEEKMGTVPYGVAIILGTLLTLFLRGV